jgi:hypothetical protein
MLSTAAVQFSHGSAKRNAPHKLKENDMDAITMVLLSNVALAAVTLVGAAWTKAGVAERVQSAMAGLNVAGASGAMIGLVSVMSVGAMFV